MENKTMQRYLIAIDLQNDFVDGALGTQEAVQIIPLAVARIRQQLDSGAKVLFTMDTHGDDYLSTAEGRALPVPHCIRGTVGWQLVPDIDDLSSFAEVSPFEKNTFGSLALAEFLAGRQLESPIEEICLIGLCTDICVLANALLIKSYLPEVPICIDRSCCAGVTPASHENALAAMQMCQISIS